MAAEFTSNYLIGAMTVILIWTIFQVITFLEVGTVPYAINVILVTIIIITCNLALFRTLVLKVNQAKMAEAEIDFQKSRQTMLSLISHEIKMPIATLQFNTEMMKASMNNPEKFNQNKDKLISLSSAAIDSIKRMLNDFIFFMSTSQKLNDCINAFEIKAFFLENWQLKLTTEACVDDLKYYYLTDKLTLKYIVNTLISNAERYSREKSKRPELFVNQTNENISIEIRDYGIGISADQLVNLGKRQAKVNEHQEVSGMGFYLANDLAKRLDHELSVVSRGKEGTSVFIQMKRK
jgi:signal transduction histidine kinase